VSPPYDHADITALLGNRVVLEVISAIARRRKDKAQGTTWDPRQPLLEGREDDEQLRLIADGEEARRRGEGTPRPHHH
jgi:agmatinase